MNDSDALTVAAQAAIPEEILETLDENTKQELTEEPKYLALTFDD